MNDTIHNINNKVNALEEQVRRIEVVIENARIVRRNQNRRSLGPGQFFSLRQKEVNSFLVLLLIFINTDVINRSLALEQLSHSRSMVPL